MGEIHRWTAGSQLVVGRDGGRRLGCQGIKQKGNRTHGHGHSVVIAGGRGYKGTRYNGKKYNKD